VANTPSHIIVRAHADLDEEMIRIVKDLRRKLDATRAVLLIRERELLALKGPCTNSSCPLHLAHSGPCDG
jgi:hypothetical protein